MNIISSLQGIVAVLQFLPGNNPNSDSDSDDENHHHFGNFIHNNHAEDAIEEAEDESEVDYEVPSLDDIIPWSASDHQKPPPLVEVLDPVYTEDNINMDFVLNALRNYFSRDGVLREVTVQSHTEGPVDTPNSSLRNRLIEVNVEAMVEDKLETFHMIIKTLLPSSMSLSAKGLFESREIGMYNQILTEINIFQRQQVPDAEEYILVPLSKCFFARYIAPSEENCSEGHQNVVSQESVVVLENVKYQGYTQVLVTEGLSAERVLKVIEGVAQLHGLALAMKERSGIPLQRSYPYLLCMKEAAPYVVDLFEKNVDHILNVAKEVGGNNIEEKVSIIRPYLRGLVEALATPDEPVSVLSHMNLWAHNILFKGDQCVIVDWQMITCTRPSFDLAFLLATSVKTSIRRQYTRIFLDHYFRHLTTTAQRYGLDIERHLDYNITRLRGDFRHCLLLAMIFCIAKADDILTTQEVMHQFIEYMIDLDIQNLINLDVLNLDTPNNNFDDPDNPRHLRPLGGLYQVCRLFS